MEIVLRKRKMKRKKKYNKEISLKMAVAICSDAELVGYSTGPGQIAYTSYIGYLSGLDKRICYVPSYEML
jgi:hypothetical protein